MEFKTDILEDEILSAFGPEVLERLLRCHSRKHADIGNKKADEADYVYYHFWAKTLLCSLIVTQDNPRETWASISLQAFSSISDREWSKSVAEEDQQLYAKYGLSEEEIAFVESMVKPME